MSWDQGIADRLRAMGVPVVEVDGWQTRGSTSFTPRGSVNHHTAGGANGTAPSLNTCIYGRPDLAGPLCNVLQSREAGEGNDQAYVIAAGRANHAGSGGYRGLSGNSSVYGLEIEHTGTVPLPMHRQQTAALIHAAMFGGDPGMICQHYEWTSRKIDAATNVNADAFRDMVATAMAGGFRPEPEEVDMMFTVLAPDDGRPFAICAPGVWIEANEEQVQALADAQLAAFPWTPTNARGYDVIADICQRGAPAAAWAAVLAANMVDGQSYTAEQTLLFTHKEAHDAAAGGSAGRGHDK